MFSLAFKTIIEITELNVHHKNSMRAVLASYFNSARIFSSHFKSRAHCRGDLFRAEGSYLFDSSYRYSFERVISHFKRRALVYPWSLFIQPQQISQVLIKNLNQAETELVVSSSVLILHGLVNLLHC